LSTLDGYLGIGDSVLKKVLERGIDEAEVYVLAVRSKVVEVQNNELFLAHESGEVGLGIRVVLDKRIGFAFTNDLRDGAVKRAIDGAISVAKVSAREEKWEGFPYYSHYPEVEDLYSVKLVSTELDQLVELMRNHLGEVLQDKRIHIVSSTLEVSEVTRVVVNTRGLNLGETTTHSIFAVDVVANDGTDTSPVIYREALSRTELPDIGAVMKDACEYAIKSLHPVKFDRYRAPVVMTEYALYELLKYTLTIALKGDSVALGRSPFTGKLGEKVLSEKLTIVDDGTMRGGISSSKFDDEGVPRRRTILIEKGILRNFIYNLYWAYRSGTESTGNAHRGFYTVTPRIEYSNLIVQEGDTSPSEVLEELSYGLLVDNLQGAHSSNPETGEFSVVAVPAWIVKRGELLPVRGIMLAGNTYELLSRKVMYICRGLRQRANLLTPWIVFEDIRVIQK